MLSTKYRSGYSGRLIISEVDVDFFLQNKYDAAQGIAPGSRRAASAGAGTRAGGKKKADDGKVIPLAFLKDSHLVPSIANRPKRPDLALGAAGMSGALPVMGGRRPSDAGAEYGDDEPDAGSFATPPPVMDSSAGLNAALTTMRKYKSMLGEVSEHDQKLAMKRREMELGQMFGAKGMDKLKAEHKANRPPKPPVSSTSAPGTASWATVPPATIGGDGASEATGNVVAGVALVNRDHLIRATMVCSKWARIIKTVHPVGVSENCELHIELQRVYFPSFKAEMGVVTGGEEGWKFVPHGEPGGIVANVGYVNTSIHGDDAWMARQYSTLPGTDPVTGEPPAHLVNRPPPLPDSKAATNVKIKVLQPPPPPPKFTITADGWDEVPKSMNPRGLTARQTNSIVPKVDEVEFGGWPILTAEPPPPPSLNRPIWNGQELPMMEEIHREDLREAKKVTKALAEKRLLKYAIEGDLHKIEDLVLNGLQPTYEDKPWYLADSNIQSTQEAEAAAAKAKVKETAPKKSVFAANRGNYHFKGMGDDEAGSGAIVPYKGGAAGGSGGGGAGASGAIVPAGGGGGAGSGAIVPAGGGGAGAPADPPVKKWKKKGSSAQELLDMITRMRIYPDINCADAEGWTPLMHAVKEQHLFVVAMLLKLGGNPMKHNMANRTAIDIATDCKTAADRFFTIATKKMEAGERKRRAADILQMLDVRDLLHCGQTGDFKRMRYLIEEVGDNPTQVNSYGMTPLHFAVMRRDVTMIKYLSLRGADLYHRNNLGQSPWSLAMDADSYEQRVILQRALEAGPKHFDELRKTAREEAAKQAKEQAMLVVFQRRLRELTRGTAAAKAIKDATADAKTIRTKAKLPPALTAGSALPVGAGSASSGLATTASGEVLIKPTEDNRFVVDLYEESAKRHAREFLALARQEQYQINARGGEKLGMRAAGTSRSGKKVSINLPVTDSLADAEKAVRDTVVTDPEDRKFHAWYLARVDLTGDSDKPQPPPARKW